MTTKPAPAPSGLKIYGVTVRFEAPAYVVKPRAPTASDPLGSPGNPRGFNVKAWAVAASTPANAEKRARAEIAATEPKATITRVRVELVVGAKYEASPDITLEIAGQSFTYKQPGCPDALRGE